MVVLVVDDASDVSAVQFFAQVDLAVARGEEGARVAFDCEGFNLGRFGSVEIVSLAFKSPGTSTDDVFLKIVGTSGSPSACAKRVAALKRLFECKRVENSVAWTAMPCTISAVS